MTQLTKRSFLRLAAASGGALVINGMPVRIALAQAPTITGVTYLTPTYNALMWGINGFVERLKQAGGDAITVEFYDSGTLLGADEQTSALRAGTIDFMVHTSSYISGSLPILGVTGLPSLVEELHQHGDRLAMGTPLYDLINEQLAGANLFMLTSGGGIMEPEYVWSGASRIASLDDMSGKKIRVVGYEAATTFEKFGVAPVRIPSSETYLALQRGTVDGAVLNISTVLGRKLQEQLKYCWKLPSTAYAQQIFLLKDRWDAMDEQTQAAYLEAARWFDENFAKTVNSDWYPNKYWPQIDEAGIEIIDVAPEDAQKFEQAAQEAWTWWKGEVGEEVGQKAIDYALGKTA
jgi:TRAP-type C4-dicarboxylate transport system substrate-binding protein